MMMVMGMMIDDGDDDDNDGDNGNGDVHDDWPELKTEPWNEHRSQEQPAPKTNQNFANSLLSQKRTLEIENDEKDNDDDDDDYAYDEDDDDANGD